MINRSESLRISIYVGVVANEIIVGRMFFKKKYLSSKKMSETDSSTPSAKGKNNHARHLRRHHPRSCRTLRQRPIPC